MIIEMRPPCAALAPFIEQYIYHADYVPAHTREMIIPTGSIDLIIDLSEQPKHLYEASGGMPLKAFQHGWISGIQCEPITIEVGSGAPMLVISFKPGGAWAFFGFPMSEVADHVEEMQLVWGRRFADLRERLLQRPHPREYFAEVDAFLTAQAGDRLEPHPVVSFAVDWIGAREGAPPTMKELAAKLGYSHKHVISLFDKLVGMSPKRYARILRFQKMVQRLSHGPAPQSWPDFAHAHGFYDQAHLINEFRAFAGVTPANYQKLSWDFINYIPVDTNPLLASGQR